MKTIEQKMIAGTIGAIAGFVIGWLICAFVAGTMDPFSIRLYESIYNPAEAAYIKGPRYYSLEGMARALWVCVVGGCATGGGFFGVYLVGQK